jgi:Zn-dependent membrane protease YugP
MGMLIYFIIIILVPILASWKVRSAYKKYSKVHSSSNMTGADVARRILNDNGIYDVTVEPVGGTLSDHYDPRAKVIRLSEGNYYGTSVAGAAVAAQK